MCNLMIVEDEPMERKALRKIIEREYPEVITIVQDAKSGLEAIKLAKILKPNIILMDIGLPEMNGLEAQKEIISFLPNVETIFLTAYSDFSYIQKAIKLNAKDYLLKPVKTKDLKESIDKSLINLKEIPDFKTILEKNGVYSTSIDEAILYMKENFKDNLDLNIISDHVHLNPQYFSRLFKKEIGINYIEYLNALKVNYACKLLSNTSLPAYRVALESGFSDPSYFSRVFTKYTQLTPNEYRRKFKTLEFKESV